MRTERFRVAQPGEEAPTVASGAVPAQLVDEVGALVVAVRADQLQVDEAGEVHLQLGVAEPGPLSKLPPGHEDVGAFDSAALSLLGDDAVEQFEQPASPRRQLVEARAEDLSSQSSATTSAPA
ncbi:MAG: hypothetical protein ACRD0Z_04765 [Acidimicrobiales bacterium]